MRSSQLRRTVPPLIRRQRHHRLVVELLQVLSILALLYVVLDLLGLTR